MIRPLLCLLTLHLCLALPDLATAQDGFRSLFNGKDLSGWTGDESLWSVEDGCITGTTKADQPLPYNKFLILEGPAVADFEFRCEFRLAGKNNSGVQYRSRHDKKLGEFVVAGYQADIHSKPEFTCMLYDERGRGILAKRGEKVVISRNGKRNTTKLEGEVKPVDLKEWHELRIIAKGPNVVHMLDGKVVVDITDNDPRHSENAGVFALQVHRGPAMKVQFRKLVLKELKPQLNKAEQATAIDSLKVKKDFSVELLYSVPKDTQGSWVNMCVDPKGRLIVSDQYGSLYRVTPPALGSTDTPKIEKINVDIGEAQGLLWAFDSLYVSVNRGRKYAGGLYRVRDTDGDDQLDTLDTLRSLNGRGEHGPHAVLPHPDGKSLVVVCGNLTKLTDISSSLVPQVWDEDLLLPRPQGRFMRGVRAPGGYICRVDPDGKNWELMASGFRNQFDAAYNSAGELFTYDADMEWDINTPWYRPTRICHVVSGAEFGWRSGGGKWPVYYEDSVPPVVNIGPGSPTGVAFGYGAKFPAEYQNALFACDWSYGKLYAVHMKNQGGTYTGKAEEFVTGIPLPLTDLIVNPHDGAMYFLIGGRKVQSGLYRVTYQGKADTAPVPAVEKTKQQEQRTQLEALHAVPDPKQLDQIWTGLGSKDRFVRFAARIALEHLPTDAWKARLENETDGQTTLMGLMAFARSFKRQDLGKEPNIDTLPPSWDEDKELDAERQVARDFVLGKLHELDWQSFNQSQKLLGLRVLTLTFVRIGAPSLEQREYMLGKLDQSFDATRGKLQAESLDLLVYLESSTAAAKLVELLENAPTQEQQIGIAKSLRHLRSGWTPELRERYFRWFTRAASYRGGASFLTFVNKIKSDAVEMLSPEDKASLQAVIDAKPAAPNAVFSAEPREFVKDYSLDGLVPLVQDNLQSRDFDQGQKMFAAAKCFACHRFDNQGGAVGPDLTALSGRFSPKDLLESIVVPSKQISDQYGAVQIVTVDGKVVNGRIVNLAGETLRVQTNMLDPGALEIINRKDVDEIIESKVSMMPKGLLNTLKEEEILDLMAYLLSRGDSSHEMFKGNDN